MLAIDLPVFEKLKNGTLVTCCFSELRLPYDINFGQSVKDGAVVKMIEYIYSTRSNFYVM